MTTHSNLLLSVKQLNKSYRQQSSFSTAGSRTTPVLQDVSLDILRGECVAVVGESGSGKTTLGRCLTRLIEPDSGRIIFDNQDMRQLSLRQFRPYRQQIQMIFQDPLQSLNPRQTVAACLQEPLKVLCRLKGAALNQRIKQLLLQSGLTEDLLSRRPQQLSGGQRQRVAIARALTLQPTLLIADEPTASLDALYKQQILTLLARVTVEMQLSVLLITHDMNAVASIADRTVVLQNGRIVEQGPTQGLFNAPQHPYTQLLIDASGLSLAG